MLSACVIHHLKSLIEEISQNEINSKLKCSMLIRHLFQFKIVFYEIYLQISQLLNEILLHMWKWHLTIYCCKKFLVVWKQTKITRFAHVMKIISLLTKAWIEICSSNTHEQIIWKKVALKLFQLCKNFFTSFLTIKTLSIYHRVKATSQPCKAIKCCALHFKWSKDPWGVGSSNLWLHKTNHFEY